jgi:hypothetical protein
MTPEKNQKQMVPEPRGFGEHTRGLSGEYAHEQGWGLDVEERTRGSKNPEGGNDYEYGARDFGDEPVNVASAQADSPQDEQSKEED